MLKNFTKMLWRKAKNKKAVVLIAQNYFLLKKLNKEINMNCVNNVMKI